MKKLFVNRYAELRFGWAVVLFFLCFLAYSILVSAFASLINLSYGETPSGFDTLLNLQRAAIVVLAFWLIYRRPPAQMGLGRHHILRDWAHGAALGAFSFTLVFLAMLAAGDLRTTLTDSPAAAAAALLTGLADCLFVGLFEEFLFRGFLMTALKTTRRRWLILSVSSLAFSLAHASNPGYNVVSAFNIFLIGFALALFFERTGSLWMPVGFHFAWNFFEGPVYGTPLSGKPAASLFHTVYEGNTAVNGGVFGPEGGFAVMAASILLVVYALFAVRQRGDRAWSMTSDLPLTRGRGRKEAAGAVPPVSELI